MEGRDHRTVFFPVIFGQLRIALHVELQGGTVQRQQQKNFSAHFKNQRGFSEGKRFRRRFFLQTIFSDDLRIHICSNDLHLGKFRINGVYMKCLFGFLFIFFQFSTNAQSYKKIHAKAILVDTHNDFLSKAVENHYAFDSDLKGITHSDLNRMKEGGLDVQFFSIFCDEHYGRGSAFAYANRELDSLYAIAARNPDRMQIVYSYRQLMNAVKHHKLAALSGVEGGHMMEDDLSYLDSFYKRGVRYMTLTWNNSTSWATSASDESKPVS